MATFAGKMKILVPDNAAALTASGTLNGASTGVLPPGLLDGVVSYIFAAIAGATVTAIQLQGSNDGASWTNVAFDKGTFVAVAAAGTQSFHFAQAQFARYRTTYTSGALTGAPIVTSLYNFHPLEYSEQATIQ
jgi:hypothetical protein